MLFPSGEFLFAYLPIVLAGFFVVARLAGMRAAAAWLTLASFIFYGFWRIEDIPLLTGSIAFNYVAGRAIQEHSSTSRLSRKTLLVGALCVNLAVLAYFKYANFLLETYGFVTGDTVGTLDITLPIGISFFTFTQIAYLVDSYGAKVRERNPLHYALFVTYFPHLIAGPVLHHADMMPQFARAQNYRPILHNLLLGLAFLAIGLAKKVLVADSAAPIANAMFGAAAGGPIGSVEAWQGIVAYTVQIYFDFSGYSDMAVGLSLLFGVRLPYNFHSPYRSASIVEFWRRWHMTLSRFLRDYLYVALGGNRRGPVRRYLNLAVTMLLGGLWHGASWTFVAWGALHGAFLIVNHGWRHFGAPHLARLPFASTRTAAWTGRLLSTALTLLCVMVAWVFFRAAGFGDALRVLGAMAGLDGGAPASLAAQQTGPWLWLAVATGIALLMPNSQQLIDERLSPALARLASARTADFTMGAGIGSALVLIVLLALVSASRDVSEFIYFNF